MRQGREDSDWKQKGSADSLSSTTGEISSARRLLLQPSRQHRSRRDRRREGLETSPIAINIIDAGFAMTVGNDVAFFIQLQLPAKQFGVGFNANAD